MKVKIPPTNYSLFRIMAVIVFIAMFFPTGAGSQLLDSGQQPPGIHWLQINTRHFRIIFPAEIATEGQRVANTLEYVYFPLRITLVPKSKKWPLILSDRSAVADGYVTLAPRKSEWYITPAQASVANGIEWYNLLAVHEGRHMVQLDRLNSGFTRLASFFLGDYGHLILTFWQTPLWFLEGDAVGTETALTDAGRGRQAEFTLPIRTLILSGQRYSYYKAYLRSYKDYYPNHYYLGYLMTTHVRCQYGADSWDRILGISTRRSWSPFTFARATRLMTGRNSRGIYNDTMTELDSLWRHQIAGLEFTPAHKINLKAKKVWTQYQWPQYQADGSIIAAIYGLADNSTLVRILPDGSEEALVRISGYNRISVKDNLVAWDVLNQHPRWGAEVYSDIAIYDLRSRQSRQITEHGKYFMPAIAPGNKMIVAVKFTPERNCNLVLLDVETGREIRTLPNPDNSFLKNPVWSPDGSRLAYFKQSAGRRTLATFDIVTGIEKVVLAECHPFDEYPVFSGDFPLYNSAYAGIDNIYAVDINSGRRFQVTSRKYGAYYPAVSPDGASILFSDYDVNGLDICEMHLDPQTWRPIESVEQRDIRYYEPLVEQEQGGNLFQPGKIPSKQFTVEDYNPVSNLLNVHSWYYFLSSLGGNFGLQSHDLLNTMAVNTDLSYDGNEKALAVGRDICYAGFYPILSAGVSLGQRVSYIGDPFDSLTTETWHETALSLGAVLPLDFSTGVYDRQLRLSLNGAYTRISDKITTAAYANGNGWFLPLSYQVSYHNYLLPTTRDIRPIDGYTLQIDLEHTPLGGDYRSRLFAAQGNYFLPGLAKHHSLHFSGTIELQNSDNYRFASVVPFSRGYDYVYNDFRTGAGMTYELPLGYPDWALGSLFYLKRLRGAFFGDLCYAKAGNFQQQYNSVGIDLNFDYNLLTFPIELNSGLRLAYRFAEKDAQLSILLLGMDL